MIYYLKSGEGDLLSKNVKEKISEEIRLAESLHHDNCQNCQESDTDNDNDESLLEGEKVFSKLAIDWSERLYNTSTIRKVHFIAPT